MFIKQSNKKTRFDTHTHIAHSTSNNKDRESKVSKCNVPIASFFFLSRSSCIFLNSNVVSCTDTMTPAPLFNFALSILSFLAAFCFSLSCLNSSAVLVAIVEFTWKRFADSLAARSASFRAVLCVCVRRRRAGEYK